MESFTEEELKIPQVKYECNDICRTVDVYDNLHNFSVCFVLINHTDTCEKSLAKLLLNV
jgi:hypothetical protein